MNSTRIGVVVRVRPILDTEKYKKYSASKLLVESKQEISVYIDEKNNKNYKFDRVLDQDCDQVQVFGDFYIANIIQKVIDGFHSTIFTYGQTGSGKTYTMEGFDYEIQQNGKGPKAVFDIENVSSGESKTFKIYVSFLQIYNEKIYDLFNVDQIEKAHSGPGLKIRWTKKEQFQVEDNYVFECHNPQEVFNLYLKGINNKVMATHKLNIASSRSHCIFTIRVDQFPSNDPDSIVSSKLQLVDLAGSERSAQTGTEGKNLKECIDINKSLFNLRQVIQILADYCTQKQSGKQLPYVPYRDSKLTSLLKQSFGGNSYCLMIACLSPCDLYQEENLSTLNYAAKAGCISNQPQKNEDPKNLIIKQLKEKNSQLMKELANANEHIMFLSKLTNENVKQFGINLLNMQFAQLQTSPVKIQDQQIKTVCNLNMDSIELINEGPEAVNNSSKREMQPISDHEPEQIKQKGVQLQKCQSEVKNDKQQLFNMQNDVLNTQSSTQTKSITINQIEEATQKGVQIQNNITKLENELNGESIGSQHLIIRRLVESVNMVRDLLQSNIEMREMIDKLTLQNENIEAEQYYLQQENQDFRDKMDIYHSMISTEVKTTQNSDKTQNFDWISQISDAHAAVQSESKVKLELINELHNYRKEKKQFMERIKQLEQECALNNPNFIYGEPGRTNFQIKLCPDQQNIQTSYNVKPSSRQQINMKTLNSNYSPAPASTLSQTQQQTFQQHQQHQLPPYFQTKQQQQFGKTSTKKNFYFANCNAVADDSEEISQNRLRTRFARANNNNSANSSRKITIENNYNSTNNNNNLTTDLIMHQQQNSDDQFFNLNNQTYSTNLDNSLGRVDTSFNNGKIPIINDSHRTADIGKVRSRQRQTLSCHQTDSQKKMRGISAFSVTRPPTHEQVINKFKEKNNLNPKVLFGNVY